MKNLIFINAGPPRVGGGCLLEIMRSIQNEKTIYDGMILTSKKDLFTREELKKYLNINPNKQFLSSHRMTCEIPQNDKRIIVIVFVRNPINKIRSHYLWARKVKADDEFPEAKKMSFEEFVREFVEKKRNSKVETLLSSFMINQINFFFPNIKKKI